MSPRDLERAALTAFGGATTLLAVGYSSAPGRRLIRAARETRAFRRPSPGGVAALGDSITRGNGEPEWGLLGRTSWLSHAVADGDLPYSGNLACGGWTTDMVVNSLPSAIARRPRVVTICTGTNDVLWQSPPEPAFSRIRQLIERIAVAGAQPVLCTLPPLVVFPGDQQAPIDRAVVEAFNSGLRGLAAETSVPVIDFHGLLVGEDGGYAAGMSADGIHPTEAAARRMGVAAIPVLRRALA